MDSILTPVILFILGLIIIIKGGDAFVDAARWISEVTGIPKLIVGATIVSLATTLPELFVSVIATRQGSIGIATGNAIGSVIANIGIGMSIGLIASPMIVDPKTFGPKAFLMIIISIALFIVGFDGKLSFLNSLILLALLGFYIYSNVMSAKQASIDAADDDKPSVTKNAVVTNLLKFALGALGIIWGADLLVDNGQIIAAALGVSEEIIGLTVIAIGTSLPELVTAFTSIAKKETSLSVGNIIGANIIDMSMILPVCSF
ncbi:MAG: calcium/sodium antiporter, partial [Oscillospiraceae bacterium]